MNEQIQQAETLTEGNRFFELFVRAVFLLMLTTVVLVFAVYGLFVPNK